MTCREPVIVFLLLLAGCASSPKRVDVDTGVPLPDRWTAVDSLGAGSDSLWWRAFGDDRLSLAIDEAFRRNYSLRIAAASVSAATAQARIAGAPRLPAVAAGLDGSRRRQNFIGFPIPGAGTQVLTTRTTSYGASLNVSWELDLWGRLRAEHSSALAEIEATRADQHAARLSLAAQVCKAWFAAVEARRQVDLADRALENRRDSTAIVRRRYESGLTASLDLRRSRSDLAGAEAALRQRQALLDRSLRQLEVLIGRYPDAEIDLSSSLPAPSGAIPAGLPAEVVARRPDLVAAERRLAGALAGVKGAKRALYPRISLTASGGTSSNQLRDLVRGDLAVWGLAANILQPIFQGGRLRAAVDLARAQGDAALAGYALAVLNAFAEVETALAAEAYLRAQEAALSEATDEARATRRFAREQYDSGVRDLLTMLEAERTVYDTESRLLTVERQRLDTRVDLHLALGGDFPAPIPDADPDDAAPPRPGGDEKAAPRRSPTAPSEGSTPEPSSGVME